MAKTTTKYVVTTEDNTIEEFSNLGLVGKFLGKKITKKDVEAGKYPMVSIESVEEESVVVAEVEVEDEGIEVPDDSTGFLPDRELDEATKRTLGLVEKAINDTPEEDAVLFDALCELEDSIRDGITLTDEQVTLVTAILNGTLVTQPLTNTDTEDSDSDTGSEDEDLPVAPPSDVEYPEVGDFKDEKAMKKFIKGLSDESLQEWCILEGAEWKANDHQSINRMRMAMAIKAKHFPSTAPKAGKKSKSKYASYSTEDLVTMALDNDVEVPDDKGDSKILRMYTIMALRKAGIIE
jgi:hypothetical protein